MDRELSTEILIDYHFGTLAAAERAAVEEALMSSAEALRAYLQLKRQLDRAQPQAEADAPSPEARLRLRAAVAELVRPRPRAGWWGCWPGRCRCTRRWRRRRWPACWWRPPGPGGRCRAIRRRWRPRRRRRPMVDFARPGPQGLAVF